jgi:hypothetical protein
MSEPLVHASLSEVSLAWLLVTAAGVTVFSLALAWLGSLIIYGKIAALRRIFPATHNIIRCHVDYLIMATLLGLVYFACIHLQIELPAAVIVILCIGVIYNPIGFLFQAVDPSFGKSDALASRVMVLLGFLPATIGFSYAMIAIIARLVGG